MRKKVGKSEEKWGQSGETETAVWTCYDANVDFSGFCTFIQVKIKI